MSCSDPVEYIRSVPEESMIRGMFFHWVTRHLKRSGLDPREYAPRDYAVYKLYPMREYLSYLYEATAAIYPDDPWQEALRKHGYEIFDNWAASGVGKTVLRGARSARAVAAVAPAIYPVMVPGARVTVRVQDYGLLVTLQDLWAFNESLQLGVWQRVMASRSTPAEVCVSSMRSSSARIEIRYSELAQLTEEPVRDSGRALVR